MITQYKEICLKVSKTLDIPVEEVIEEVEKYSRGLFKAASTFTDAAYDFYGILSMTIYPYKLKKSRDNGYFKKTIESGQVTDAQLDYVYNKAKTLDKNRLDKLLAIGSYLDKDGNIMSQEEIDSYRKIILDFCKEIKPIREIKKLDVPATILREQLVILRKEGKMVSTGFRSGKKYKTV